MSRVTVAELIKRAKTTAQDIDFVQWLESEWLDWYNECLLTLVTVAPNAVAVNRTLTLVQGSRQTIPETAARLVDVVRNTTSGRAIRNIDRKTLDEQFSTWHKDLADEAYFYVYDAGVPTTFYVYPALKTAGVQIDVVLAEKPVAATQTSDVIAVSDWYAPAIVDYLLYRAYLKNADYTNDLGRSDNFYNKFLSKLGVSNGG